MKIFIDTNIFLDLIFKRKYYREALSIFEAIELSKFESIILDITILNIDYIAKVQVEDIREFLQLINNTFEIVGATNQNIAEALVLANSDLEDNLQYIIAKEHDCDCIVTNDKKFINEDIPLFTSYEFDKRFISKGNQ